MIALSGRLPTETASQESSRYTSTRTGSPERAVEVNETSTPRESELLELQLAAIIPSNAMSVEKDPCLQLPRKPLTSSP